MIFRKVVIGIVIVTTVALCAAYAAADDYNYGPPLEFGAGAIGFRMQSRPEWSSKYIYGGSLNGALRIFRGLAVQGGIEYCKGDEPRPDMIDYGPGIRLWTHEKTYKEVRWYGLRYELPARLVHSDFFGLDAFMVGAGMSSTKFGLYSSYLFPVDDTKPINLLGKDKFRVATADGVYVSLSGRWIFDMMQEEGDAESFLGSYGIEIGGRYTRYGDISLRHDNIKEPRDSFNSIELFFNGFVRFNLLY